MSTSGTTSFNETALQIITNALVLIKAIGAGETVTTNDYNLSLSFLNQMIKSWMAQGVHLWTVEEGILYLVTGQALYKLPGANSSDGSGTPTATTLTSAASGTSISVVSTTGMTVGDNIGIKLDNNTLFWTTITGTLTSTTATLTATISSSASSGNAVFTYTTAMPRPLNIHAARYRNSGGFDRVIKVEPRQKYMEIASKTQLSEPLILFYDPQMSTGSLYLWPCPNNTAGQVIVTYSRTLQDFNNTTDNPDLPQEWIEPIVYNLAIRLAPAFGINLSSGGISGNPDILRQAAQYLDDLKAWDCEEPYIQIVPAYRYYDR